MESLFLPSSPEPSTEELPQPTKRKEMGSGSGSSTYEQSQEKVKTLRTGQKFQEFKTALPATAKLDEGVYFHTNYATPIDCMDPRFHYGKFVGSGSFARVYEAHDPKEMTNYVMKVQRLDREIGTKAFQEEVNITKKMGELGVGPKVVKSWNCKDVKNIVKFPRRLALNGVPIEEPQPDQVRNIDEVGFLVMERLDDTLWHWEVGNRERAKKYKEFLTEKLANKIELFWKAGYVDKDRHAKNIMLKLDKDENPIDIFFIDFGLTDPGKLPDRFLDEKVISTEALKAAEGLMDGQKQALDYPYDSD